MAGKIDAEAMEEIHNRVRKEFFYPPTRLQLVGGDDAPCIENGLIRVNPDIFADVLHAEGILAHEIGHIEICPASVAKGKRYLEIVAEELGKADSNYYSDMELCHTIMNVIADMIVDKDERILRRLPHRMDCDLRYMKKKMKGKLPTHPFWLILTQYYSILVKKKLVPVPPKEQETGKKAHRIITSLAPTEIKIRKMAHLLADQEFMKQYEEMKKFMQQLDDAMGKALSKLKARENTSADPGAVKRAIGDAVETRQGKGKGNAGAPAAGSEKEKRLLIGLATAAHVDFDDYDYLRAIGRKKIEFTIKIQRPSVGKVVRGSLEPWTPDDEASELEVEDSVMNSPMLIPGVSTLKAEKKMGYEEAPSVPPVLMVLDTSGSMDRDDALVICYSFLSACESYKTPASVILFSGMPYYSAPFTENYEELARGIYNGYCGGGTDTLRAAQEAGEKLHGRPKSLLIFISDFECYKKDKTVDLLRELKRDHFVVCIVLQNSSISRGDFVGLKAEIVDGPDGISNLVIDELGAFA